MAAECECVLAGFCNRHQMRKTQREVTICNGTASGLSCSKMQTYRDAWERPRIVKSGQSEPIIGSGREQKTTGNPGSELKKLLSWFGESDGCNCSNHAATMDRYGIKWCKRYQSKIVGWLSEAAAKKSILGFSLDRVPGFEVGANSLVELAIARAEENIRLSDLVPPLIGVPIANPVRHFIWHCYPVNDNGDVWRQQIDRIKQTIGEFNGVRAVAVGTPGKADAHELERFDTVKKAWGNDFDCYEVANVKNFREGASFIKLVSLLAEHNGPNDVAFYGHNKGVTHRNADSICHAWADAMFETVLENSDAAIDALATHGCAGSFKRYGQFTTPGNHRWHYSGTFYWLRLADVFARKWQRIDRRFFASESWPGLQFNANEAACLFYDQCGDIYHMSREHIAEKLTNWRLQNARV